MDWTLLTCNYNTPELVLNLERSFRRFHPTLPLVVVNTSSSEDLNVSDAAYRRTFSLPNSPHGFGVNLGLSKVNTKFCLLLDSDVLILTALDKLFTAFTEEFAAGGEIHTDVGGKHLYPRIAPWFCAINTELVKGKGIEFFDPVRTQQSRMDKVRVYDIGSTFYEDLVTNKLKIAQFNLEGKMFVHIGGMSWYSNKFDPSKPDTDIDFGGTHPSPVYHQAGLQRAVEYKSLVSQLLGN